MSCEEYITQNIMPAPNAEMKLRGIKENMLNEISTILAGVLVFLTFLFGVKFICEIDFNQFYNQETVCQHCGYNIY